MQESRHGKAAQDPLSRPRSRKRGEQYSQLHNTNVSQLVNRFLSALPIGDEDENKFSPTVRRLIGIAPDGDAVQEYHEHLVEKHGR